MQGMGSRNLIVILLAHWSYALHVTSVQERVETKLNTARSPHPNPGVLNHAPFKEASFRDEKSQKLCNRRHSDLCYEP